MSPSLGFGVSLALAASAMPAAGAPRLGPPAVDLVFLNAPAADEPLRDAPRLTVQVNDGPARPAVVDTGSTGVLLSAVTFPAVDQLPQLGPGSLTYSSSGRIMRGRWVLTPLTIAGRTGRVVTRPMPVLAVDSIACTLAARRCTPEDRPAHVAMLGIGFGRAHDGQPGAGPDRNPLLNLAAPSELPRAFAIDRRGVRLGAAADGFTLIKLRRTLDGTDWATPPACIILDDNAPACGTMLIDTGVASMFLTLPLDRLPSGGAGTLPYGTRITVELTPDRPEAGLRFVVRTDDTADPASPTGVTLTGIGRRPPFVNTGVRFLNRFSYRYDGGAGTVGYRPTER